jgi:hypothetical protein
MLGLDDKNNTFAVAKLPIQGSGLCLKSGAFEIIAF